MSTANPGSIQPGDTGGTRVTAMVELGGGSQKYGEIGGDMNLEAGTDLWGIEGRIGQSDQLLC